MRANKNLAAVLFLSVVLRGIQALAENPSTIEIIPGRSLGDVVLGDTKAILLERGFLVDPERAQTPFTYLNRGTVYVRLVDGAATEVWIDNLYPLYPRLRFQRKKLPRQRSLKDLIAFFSPCEEPVEGTGGSIFYCQDRGLTLTTHRMARKQLQLGIERKP